MSAQTKPFYTNEMTHVSRGQPELNDLGYSLDIPWNDIYTTGWVDSKPTHDTGVPWGNENKLVTSRQPEFYAPDGLVRSNVLPIINIHDARYQFDRQKYTYTIY